LIVLAKIFVIDDEAGGAESMADLFAFGLIDRDRVAGFHVPSI